jgi:glutamate synthase domain-containing protein 2
MPPRFCPTLLTNKIEENPAKILSLETATRWAVNMVYGWTEELKNILDAVGVSSVRELVSRRDLLLGLNVGEDELRLMGVRGA